MIKVNNVVKSFGAKKVLDGISFTVDAGETLAIIGRSGTGKSVLLKLMVGLLLPDSGSVEFEGRPVEKMSPSQLFEMRSRIGYVFQGAALFDSMTVFENVTLSLFEDGVRDHEVLENEAQHQLVNVGLLPVPTEVPAAEFEKSWNQLAAKRPAELSGGMRKRVGVARALVGSPDYVMYDEPTTGLDPITSKQIDDLVRSLSDRLDVTSLVITHDIFSVDNVADRVIMLDEGKIVFEGSPQEMRVSSDKTVQGFIARYA